MKRALLLLLATSACASVAPPQTLSGPARGDTFDCLLRTAAAEFRVLDPNRDAGQFRAEREVSQMRSPLSPADVDAMIDRVDFTVQPDVATARVVVVLRAVAGRDVGSERTAGPRQEAADDVRAMLAACGA